MSTSTPTKAATTATLSAIPTLRGLPFVGNLPDFRADRLDLLLRVGRECGDIGALRIGPRTIVMVNSAELAQEILVDQAANFHKTSNLRVYGRPVLGNGLLTSENDFHKRERKLVAPAFQHRRIAIYADTMADYGERIQREWADDAEINVTTEMMRLTLGVVGKTLFDADVLDDAPEIGAALTTAMEYVNSQFGSLVHLPPSLPLPRNRRFRQATQQLDAIIYRFIAERRASGEDRGDLLSMLLAARDADDGSFMTDEQVRDEAMTLFLAGHETTANALSWAWYLLTQHPAVYDRLRAEVDATLGDRTPTFADLPNLPYTMQVFKETLRLYPPAPVLSRAALVPVELGGYTLPAESVILLSPYALHRRPDYFPDPERFDPDRFTPEAERALPKHAYIPFGSGPRVCIGNQFALMEGQILLAALAQRVTFTLSPNQQVVPEPLITLRPRQGIRMRVARRG